MLRCLIHYAHALASFALQCSSSKLWIKNFPLWLAKVMDVDKVDGFFNVLLPTNGEI